MAHPDPRKVNEILTTILTIGGSDADGSGISVLPSGKVVKIPPRQDLQAIPAEQRDEMIVDAIQVLAQGLTDEQTRTRLEQAAAQTAG